MNTFGVITLTFLVASAAAAASASAASASAAASAASATADQSLADFLTASLLHLKAEMAAGIPSLDIPPMDPLALPDVRTEWTGDSDNRITLLVKEASALDLTQFDPRRVDAAEKVDGDVEMRLAFPAICFEGACSAAGSLLGLPFESEGDADLTVVDAVASVSATLKVDAGIASLSDVRVRLDGGAASLLLQRRLPGVAAIVDEALRKLADSVFEAHFRPAVEAALGEALTKALNAALALRSAGGVALTLPPARVFQAGNANDFLDHVIAQARPAIAKQDPLDLPEAKAGFEKKILGVTIHGEAKLYNGFLYGIQTIHRTGDAEMTQSPDMTKLKIKAHLGVANLHGYYRMHAKFMNMGPSAEISIKVSLISTEIDVNVDMSSGKPTPQLEHFDINYVGDIALHFDGLGPLDWLINPLGGWIINLVKHKIADAVEGPLRKLIADKMQGVEFPIGF